MKLTIVNNGTVPAPAPGSATVAPGSSLTMTSRTLDEAQQMIENHVSDLVKVFVELEDADYPPLKCVKKAPADPAANAVTLAACGFDIEDLYGSAYSTDVAMYLGAFDDAACTVPSTTATLGTAATGTIDEGEDTNAIKVTPAGGVLSVTLTIPAAADQVVYLKAWAATGRPMDTSDVHTATFSVT